MACQEKNLLQCLYVCVDVVTRVCVVYLLKEIKKNN